MYQYNC